MRKRRKMATKKTNSYIDLELEWLEKKAKELKEYCDANPINTLTDRVRNGKVISDIEKQIKSIRDTLQDYVKIIEAIDKLREKEEVKKSSVRGDQELTPIERGEI